MYRKLRFLLIPFLVILALALSACSGGQPTSQQSESNRQQSSYDKLVAADPAHEMNYSPTRKTINFWVDTWNKPGQLAYVYLQNANGDLIGYFVLDGPPVSMCTALTPNYRFVNPDGDQANTLYQVPAPGIDGVYYSGGECNTYYGKDATTGAYVEFTLGQSMNLLLFNEPMTNHPNVENLAPHNK